MSIEAKLEQARKDKESIELNIAELEKQLEESKKPKHGEFSVDSKGNWQLVVEDRHCGRQRLIQKCGVLSDDLNRWGLIRGLSGVTTVNLDDIADDLKAMQEDITEFELTDDCWVDGSCGSTKTKIYIDDCGRINIDHNWNGNTVCQYFSPKGLIEYTKKLRAMYATAQRLNSSK